MKPLNSLFFTEAKQQACNAQLLATKVRENISAESIRLTERPLDEYSRGARLARHWANLAGEQGGGNYPTLDAAQIFSSLKKLELHKGILSSGDPEGVRILAKLTGDSGGT
jgi:hypothetical protein